MTTCQNSSYMASSATANDQLGEGGGGKRNASRTPLRTPSQALTSMSPFGKLSPRNDPCGAVSFIPEQEQLTKTRITEAQKKCAACMQARIGLISHIIMKSSSSKKLWSSSETMDKQHLVKDPLDFVIDQVHVNHFHEQRTATAVRY